MLGRDGRGNENVAILGLNLSPDRSCGLSNAIFGDEFTRHRGQHIVVFIEYCSPSWLNLPSIASETSDFLPIKRKQLDCIVSS